MDVIHSFVQHVALHQYRMEHWRDGMILNLWFGVSLLNSGWIFKDFIKAYLLGDKIDQMEDFDELDFIVENNNVDFGPYQELSGTLLNFLLPNLIIAFKYLFLSQYKTIKIEHY